MLKSSRLLISAKAVISFFPEVYKMVHKQLKVFSVSWALQLCEGMNKREKKI